MREKQLWGIPRQLVSVGPTTLLPCFTALCGRQLSSPALFPSVLSLALQAQPLGPEQACALVVLCALGFPPGPSPPIGPTLPPQQSRLAPGPSLADLPGTSALSRS